MKKIPNFENEEEEREFWSDSDSTDYVDWSKAERVTLANLRPSIKKISIRLPQAMLEELKVLVNKMRRPWHFRTPQPLACHRHHDFDRGLIDCHAGKQGSRRRSPVEYVR